MGRWELEIEKGLAPQSDTCLYMPSNHSFNLPWTWPVCPVAVIMPASEGCCESTPSKVPTSCRYLIDWSRQHFNCLMRDGRNTGPGLARLILGEVGWTALSQYLGYFIR